MLSVFVGPPACTLEHFLPCPPESTHAGPRALSLLPFLSLCLCDKSRCDVQSWPQWLRGRGGQGRAPCREHLRGPWGGVLG